MSLLDLLTGGKSSEASGDLTQALGTVQDVQDPTAAQLTLPQLQQYVNAGLMTPAQAQAVMQQQSAMNGVNADPATTEAEMTALNQMQEVAGDNGMTPQMRAQIAAATNAANTNTQGERASILDSAAQRGIPTSLMGEASQEAAAGQDAQTANLVDTQAAGTAEQNALTAMANGGNLAGEINNQEFSQGAQKAAATNAINQWNAQNQTNVNEANAGRVQQANEFNTQTNQAVSNANTQNANARTQYNAAVPQTVYNNAMEKANAEAGINEDQAGLATGQGQQTAGAISGLINMATPAISFMGMGVNPHSGGGVDASGGQQAQAPQANDASSGGFPTGEANAATGGNVPGKADVPGDSQRNDKVRALLSPGEVVVPRTIAHNPDRVKQFVAHLLKQPKPIKPMHPDDLHGMMEALSRRREAA